MPIVMIETSTERGVVAIMEGSTPLFSEELPFGYQNSKFLFPTLHAALLTSGLSIQQMEYIAVGIGPGSYTGIRLGVIVAKALAYATKIPLVGVCSLETFLPSHDGPFAVLIDARISGLYLVTGIKMGDRVTYVTPPRLASLEQAADLLKGITTLVTPDSRRLQVLFSQQFPNKQWQWQESPPNIAAMHQNALNKWLNHETSPPGGQLEILYLRKTQAEIEKKGG
jgi:tRNA threonylcarbamoyladenosine biosynthesis protein TsaB